MNDLEVLFVLGPAVLLLAIVCELIWRNRYVKQWVARKTLHIGAVGACAIAPLLLEDLTALIWIVISSELVLIWLVLKGHLFDQEDGKRSWGIMLFPLPYLFLLLVEEDRWLISLPMCILAFSDALAAIAGNLYTRGRYSLTGDPKSIIGSSVFFVVTCVMLLPFAQFREVIAGLDLLHGIVLLVSISVIITLLEAIGSRGWDNIFIPLSAWLLIGSMEVQTTVSLQRIALEEGLILLSLMIFFPVVLRSKWLRWSGAIAAMLIAMWVVFFAGMKWLLPLILFLALSSLIGKAFQRKRNTVHGDVKEGKPRDAMQVLCNAGVFAVAAAVFQPPYAAIAMAISITISAADTWASEIGTAMRSVTRDIFSWREVPAGLSGGVSLPGSMAALAGSFIFGIIGSGMSGEKEFLNFTLLIVAGGMLGMLFDSLLGSLLQPRFRNANGEFSDRSDQGKKISGFNWMNNDLVNLFSNALVTAVMIWWIHG
jgi:uncharacterized protein (TIGR00297 family)